ncbi:MAG: ThuA domain-containing protein [Fibrobacteria bacterium]
MKNSSLGLKAALGVLALASLVAAQIPNAPKRPTCTTLTGEGSCDWKATNGVGAGVRVILSDRTGGHDLSKTYLRDALTRLSQKYGFTLTRITDLNDITDTYLQNAKVIIFSNGDGDNGKSIPNATVRTRVENFVTESGWGMLMIHAACAFIRSWPFQQQACVQQYGHHNNPGTPATVQVENRAVSGNPHGRMNPYASFLLAGLPDSVRMSDEWYTWESSPLATTQVGGAPITNKIMLLKANEGSFASAAPKYGADHHLAWATTLGNGISIFNSIGHDDTYAQDGTRRAYGDSLLWRQIRYLAKDWDVVSSVSLISSQLHSQFSVSENAGSINLALEGRSGVAVNVVDVAGHRIYSRVFNGEKTAEIKGLKRGVYFVTIAMGLDRETRRLSLY